MEFGRRAQRERKEEFAPRVEDLCGTPACKSRIALPNSARQARTDGKSLETDSILAFAELVPSEVAEAVVGGVFVGFAERGVIENLLDEFVDGETVVEGHHADVDEFGGVFADDTGAQEFFIGSRRGGGWASPPVSRGWGPGLAPPPLLPAPKKNPQS